MKPIIFCGFHHTGKTSFIEKAAQSLIQKGYTVSTVKNIHICDDTWFDKGDSKRLFQAGSSTTLLTCGDKTISITPVSEQEREDSQKRLHLLLKTVQSDFTLIEGFKKNSGPIPKIVFGHNREEIENLIDDLTIGYSGIGIQEPGIGGIRYLPFTISEEELVAFLEQYSIDYLPNLDCRECGFSSCRELAKEIVSGKKSVDSCIHMNKDIEVSINGKTIEMKGFVKSILRGVIKGFVENLRGYEEGEIKITLR